MIYVFPSPGKPIRQGDIFACIPRASVSLTDLSVVTDSGTVESQPWKEIAESIGYARAILPVDSVYAIVASQDCDAQEAPELTLCEIGVFQSVEGKAKETSKPKKWQSIITQHARINQKWFYLPPDPDIGFSEKMAVDFRRTLRVRRADLETHKVFRRGRLNAIAGQHFRERLGQYFRRYPYNEWYSLDKEEVEAYENSHKREVEPRYPWQQ